MNKFLCICCFFFYVAIFVSLCSSCLNVWMKKHDFFSTESNWITRYQIRDKSNRKWKRERARKREWTLEYQIDNTFRSYKGRKNHRFWFEIPARQYQEKIWNGRNGVYNSRNRRFAPWLCSVREVSSDYLHIRRSLPCVVVVAVPGSRVCRTG